MPGCDPDHPFYSVGYDEWLEKVMAEPWVRALEDMVKWTGMWVSGSTTLRLPCTHLGSMALSHGLCLGKRQLTILTPSPLSLTSRL